MSLFGELERSGRKMHEVLEQIEAAAADLGWSPERLLGEVSRVHQLTLAAYRTGRRWPTLWEFYFAGHPVFVRFFNLRLCVHVGPLGKGSQDAQDELPVVLVELDEGAPGVVDRGELKWEGALPYVMQALEQRGLS